MKDWRRYGVKLKSSSTTQSIVPENMFKIVIPLHGLTGSWIVTQSELSSLPARNDGKVPIFDSRTENVLISLYMYSATQRTYRSNQASIMHHAAAVPHHRQWLAALIFGICKAAVPTNEHVIYCGISIFISLSSVR